MVVPCTITTTTTAVAAAATTVTEWNACAADVLAALDLTFLCIKAV